MNSACLSGNIGRDPEIRSAQSGTSILSFSLAVNERIKKGDEWTDYTNWIEVVMFGRRADSLGKILAKGMKVAVSGHLHYSSWEDKSGNKRSKLELIADDLDFMQRKEDQQNGSYGQQPQYAPQNGYHQPTGYQQQYAPQPTHGYTEQQIKRMAGGSINNPANYSGDLYSTDRPF